MLLLNDLVPWPWFVGGAALGAITLVLLWAGNQRLGISTGFENLCALVLRTPYLHRAEVTGSQRWRLPFIGGLVLGGLVSAVTSGGWTPFWDAGMLDARFGLGPLGKLTWMFSGGLLIGFGTRLSGGCTSGHSIFGVSNLERASLEATLSFLVGGMLVTALVHGAGIP